LHADLPLVWEKLKAGIPPAERIDRRSRPGTYAPSTDAPPGAGERWSSPIDLASILTGAYAWWHAGRAARPEASGTHRNFPDAPGALEDWLSFNAFVRGTIELAGLHERMWEDRERLDGLNDPRLDGDALG
jgi:hypothetical protein